jgi:hypothetical protein
MKRMALRAIAGIGFFVLLIAGTAQLAAQPAPKAGPLEAYTSCQFADGLQIVQVDPLAPGVTSRTVDTDGGPREVDLKGGLRIMFAYPDTDFYANVKAELLPAANYPQLKQSLLENFQYLARGNVVNKAVPSPMDGLEVHGLDREKLEGGVLGIYLFFDDAAHVVTTIYLLNQEPEQRKFQTMEEYRSLRDKFLVSYASCIRKNQQSEK